MVIGDPLDPHDVENLRRSIAMLTPGQDARLSRERAVTLLDELVRLQTERRQVARELKALLERIQGVDRHPSGGDLRDEGAR